MRNTKLIRSRAGQYIAYVSLRDIIDRNIRIAKTGLYHNNAILSLIDFTFLVKIIQRCSNSFQSNCGVSK